MNDTNRDRLDELIDRALAGYTDAEPLAGLEERILRRVEAAPSKSHWPWYRSPRFVVALASMFVVIGVVAIRWRSAPAVAPAVEKTQASVQRRTESVAPPQTAENLQTVRPPLPTVAGVRPKVSAKIALPKKDRFPSDAPLTSEERALLTWSTRAPKQMRELLASLKDERTDRPVTVEPIRIEPLPSDGNE